MSDIIFKLIEKEAKRQNEGIELIASENYASTKVRLACGSILTNKYAEGYPSKRYYGGCEVVDEIENIAIQNACKLFNAKFANVQPHSGSQANAAAYRALLPNGGKILSLVLNDGGHLTHGSPVSFSSNLYTFVHYPLNKNGKLDYEVIEKIATTEKPDLILAGYSAYPFEIDFAKFRNICDKVGCYFMVDMAHIAGLIAGKAHQNPMPFADVVTSTTHKTLRGPRGGLILTNDETLAKKINSAIFPFYQGGPLEHIIAGKAICFEEALTPEFETYANAVVQNTKACCDEFLRLGAVASGTQNHLFLINTIESYNLTGAEAESKLQQINVTVNKNMIPGDELSPKQTSGIRVGLAAVTTRGCTIKDARDIANAIHNFLKGEISKESALEQVLKTVSSWKDINDI